MKMYESIQGILTTYYTSSSHLVIPDSAGPSFCCEFLRTYVMHVLTKLLRQGGSCNHSIEQLDRGHLSPRKANIKRYHCTGDVKGGLNDSLALVSSPEVACGSR